jgi:hypothetical protein
MSQQKRVPYLHIAESVPMLYNHAPYNYLSNSDFLPIHNYNGNSFRPTPFQHIGGQFSSTDRSADHSGMWMCLESMILGKASCFGLGRTDQDRNQVSKRPRGISQKRGYCRTGNVHPSVQFTWGR